MNTALAYPPADDQPTIHEAPTLEERVARLEKQVRLLSEHLRKAQWALTDFVIALDADRDETEFPF